MIRACRICGCRNLKSIINLGNQALAGYFPSSKKETLKYEYLELVKCMGECGLVQLRDSFLPEDMYGDQYAYESGINKTMQRHLKEITTLAKQFISLEKRDIVIDIGSNDGTLLKTYPKKVRRIGVDPSGEKFRKYYDNGIELKSEFFEGGLPKARIITSIAMFYDLPDPLKFMRDIRSCLTEDGIWITEQSYFPFMIANKSYDTICHEHLEYYGLKQIKWMADKVGLKIIAGDVNRINGGSMCLVLSKKGRTHSATKKVIKKEEKISILDFASEIKKEQQKLKTLVEDLIKKGKKIYGYGASTKGNVILQSCGLDHRHIIAIADRNPSKHGKVTPETNIPIISEDKMRKAKPDYLLVLPWHFKKEFVRREKAYLKKGGKLIFPIPEIEIIGG